MPTKIAPGVYAVDLCTYLPSAKALIISDLHLGFEEEMGKQGVFVPRVQLKETLTRLEWIFGQVPIKQVILNGDVKHEFGTISKQEWREVTRLVEFLRRKNARIIAVKGNHDTIFGPIARKLELQEVNEVKYKDILIVHGDYVPKKLLPIIIMGHEHPAITLREKAKVEKFKCFVKTKFKSSTVIVQPSFNQLTQGTDILKGELLSPLLIDLSYAEVFIVNDKTHDVLPFGNVNKLQ